MTLAEIHEKLKSEHARSLAKHGKWKELSDSEQHEAIRDEFREWWAAYNEKDIDGPHGEIAELIQLANVCFRRVMFLTGEDQ